MEQKEDANSCNQQNSVAVPHLLSHGSRKPTFRIGYHGRSQFAEALNQTADATN